jgi:hypothetical protein
LAMSPSIGPSGAGNVGNATQSEVSALFAGNLCVI